MAGVKGKKTGSGLVGVSGNPDDFTGGGPDNFRGTIIPGASRFEAWRSDRSTTGKYGLYARFDIQPHPDNDDAEGLTIGDDGEYKPVTLRWRAGYLGGKRPSVPGEGEPPEIGEEGEPAGATAEEYQALHKGEADIPEGEEENYAGNHYIGAANRDTDWAQVLRALKACGWKGGWPRKIDEYDGLDLQWNRMTADKQMEPRPGEERREWKILLPTEMFESKKGAKGASKPAATKKATKPIEEESEPDAADDPDAPFIAAIAGALADAPKNTLHKSKLGQVILNGFSDDKKARAAGLAFINKTPKLAAGGGGMWEYDANTGNLTLA